MKKPRPPEKIEHVGRKRKAAGWTLLALGMLVAGMWVTSGWRPFYLSGAATTMVIDRGDVVFEDFGTEMARVNRSPWGRQRVVRLLLREASTGSRPSWNLRTHLFDADDSGEWAFEVSFWPIPLLFLPSAALLLRSGVLARRRAKINTCAKCGYSLAGITAGSPCPECGKPQP